MASSVAQSGLEPRHTGQTPPIVGGYRTQVQCES